MELINIWELGCKIHIKLYENFLKRINSSIRRIFKSKEKFYNEIKDNLSIPYTTFRNILKYSYYKKGYCTALDIFIVCCKNLGLSKIDLQNNISSYKTKRGVNVVINPILPIEVTPVFDMILAHNIADGTVIDPRRNRQVYFGYRQFDEELRILYIKKIESIFGKINFKDGNYFEKSTRPYCPAVLSQLFFKIYNLNKEDFLSRKARIPKDLLKKDREYLLAVLLAFIIDEGSIDSTLICIRLKNPNLTEDLFNICNKLNYKSTFVTKGDYGTLYILRDGMKKLFLDYKELLKKYPEVYLGKFDEKIENGLKIYDRMIYKSKGNREQILEMLKKEDLTVNQLANRMSMTRQGTRFHVKKLEKDGSVFRKGYVGKKNIIYSYGGGR